MTYAKVCTKTCQLLVVCGYAVAGLLMAPFLLILLPGILINWAGEKITECANKEEELT